MIAKIQPPSDFLYAALSYNERKATGAEGIRDTLNAYIDESEKGHIIKTWNVPHDVKLWEEFDRLEELNARTRKKGKTLVNTCFHMSINPGPTESHLDEKTIAEIVEKAMSELGYGDNPYALFKHTDIERHHYHVVTTRIGQNGLKINDKFEEKRILTIMKKLGKEYGFTMGVDKQNEIAEKQARTEAQIPEVEEPVAKREITRKKLKEEAKAEAERKKAESNDAKKTPEKKYIEPFSPKSSLSVTEQMKLFHEETMKWSFTTPEQYAEIMRYRFNVAVEEYDDGLKYYGLDDNGDKATIPVSWKDIDADVENKILTKCMNEKMSAKRDQRNRLEKLIAWAAENSKDWKSFEELMKRKGVIIILHYTKDEKIFGITYLDRATRCAWKGSDTSTGMEWIQKKTEEKGWKMPLPKKPKQTKTTKAAEIETKKKTPKAKENVPASNGKNEDGPKNLKRLENQLQKMKHTGRRSDNEQTTTGNGIYEDEAEKIMNWRTM